MSAAGAAALLNNTFVAPPGSIAESQMSVRGKKKLLDLEAKRKWREFEKTHQESMHAAERQLDEAIAKCKRANDAFEQMMTTIKETPYDKLSKRDRNRYDKLHSTWMEAEDEVKSCRKQVNIVREQKGEEKRRLDEDLQEEYQRVDILEEENQQAGSRLGVEENPFEKVNRWRIPNLPFPRESDSIHQSYQDWRYHERPADVNSMNERDARDAADRRKENLGNENQDNTKIGVGELVHALSSAFGGNSGNEKKLPIFSGCPAEWLTFYSACERMNQPKKVERSVMMRRLGEALRGKAKEAVQHLMSNPDNLGKVIEILERRFGRPEFVLDYLVEKVKACRAVEMKNPESIINFGTCVEALVENVTSYKRMSYLKDKNLQQQILDKLPGPLRYRWHEFLIDNYIEEADLLELSNWIRKQVMIAERDVKPSFSEDYGERNRNERDREPRNRNERDRRPRRETPGGIHAASGTEALSKCVICDKTNHSIIKCFAFEKKTPPERRALARKKGLCYLCLKPGHMTMACEPKKKCDVKGCGKNHHPLLHEDNFVNDKEEVGRQPPYNPDTEDSTTPSAPRVEKVIGTAASSNIAAIIPVKVRGPTGTRKVYALLDLGATFSVIDASVAAKIGLKGTPEQLDYTVFGDKRSEESWNCSLEVAGAMKNAEFYEIKTIHAVRKIDLPPRTFDAEELKQRYPHLRRMKVASMKNAKPMMVIGLPSYTLYAARGDILETGKGEIPAAVNSLLGWYVIQDEDSLEKQLHVLCQCKKKEEELSNAMKEFFSTESFGVKVINQEGRSKDDIRALSLLAEHTERDGDRWKSCLLWKDDLIELPPSYQMAMNRLKGMERKMDKDPSFAELCIKKFQEYEEKGFLSLRKDAEKKEKRRWYLPWFFALHPTKKPRLVFDAAAKVGGKSLNDFLCKGPDLLRPLPAILMRFRRHQIGLTADIKEMFHQVMLIEEDRPSQTVLFRGMERKSPPKEYEMNVLFFGSASSPCSAIYAKDRNAEDFQDKYPAAVKSTKLDFYMDDDLTGEDEVESVIELRKQLSEIHDAGGFLLCKWNSSCKDVLKTIPPELRAESTVNLGEKGEAPMEKTLGIYWDPIKDNFGFKVTLAKVPEEVKNLVRLPTKREMASVIMSLFDPLGFATPVKVKALCLMQEVWRQGTDWDQTISSSMNQDWKSWMEEIRELEKIRIPRKLSPVALKNCTAIELHCFVDASQDAFAAVVYLRIETGGSVVTPFIMGKARVAPLRKISIPRMELQAAVMGGRLVSFVEKAFNGEVKIEQRTFWSDSKTVLCWIRSTNGRFNTFVSNRVGELAETTNVQEWRWIPTKLNVADDATRAQTEAELTSKSRWLTGPEFLKLEEREWPAEDKLKTSKDVLKEDLEEQNPRMMSVAVEFIRSADEVGSGSSSEECGLTSGRYAVEEYLKLNLPDPDKYSNWFRLVRATAQAVRSIELLRGLQRSRTGLTMKHINLARDICIARAQRRMFPEDLKQLEAGKEVNRQSRLYSLNAALNNKGIIVHSGRIEKAAVSSTVKTPPILDGKDPYTRSMILAYHESGGHWGQERILNELRQQVWITDGKAAVRQVWAKCLFCQQRKATPRPPQMGQLPEARMDVGKPAFYNTGVDYFGPYEVKLLRSTVKRYGVIFTCLTTRAVHLELAQSLDTNDYINTLARFISVRGRPSQIWSDNGKNFLGADSELRECLQHLDPQKIEEWCMTKEIEFKFICPASPHMGGSWERLIGSVKKILSTLIKEHNPKEDTLRTFLYEVMAIMNSRPITHASVDPDDDLCLTPNHILNVPCIVGPTIPGEYDESDRLRKSWRHCQLLAEEFWRRFSVEYLPWLSKRQKWLEKVDPLEVGDVVIVLEDNVPRNAWKKAMIQEVMKDKKGQVRQAVVRIAIVDPKDKKKEVKFKILRRPVMKLCKITLGENIAFAGRENVRDEGAE